MKHFLIAFFVFSFFTSPGFSQDNEILITINDKKISLNEFERIYKKNNSLNIAEKQSVEEYLELFIIYKLKVLEAESLGMDTVSTFVNELDGYVRQLAKPHLMDSILYEQLLLETYERMKKEVNVSHIMAMLNEKASPEDTLIAYNKIIDIRNRALKGENFSNLALLLSEDPSAMNNKGDLGWFGAFRMVYPFEVASYSTPVGRISMPVRSKYGYHLIKVNDVRPALPKLLVAHIFVRAPQNMSQTEYDSAQAKAFSLFEQLENGAEFENLAKLNSDDKSTGTTGGQLPWFATGEMIPEFENAAYSIKEPGQYSKPVKSNYGWHIIKLIDIEGRKSFQEEKPEIVKKLNNSDHAFRINKDYIDKLKKDHRFTIHQDNFSKIYSLVDSSIFLGTWSDSIASNYDDVIITISDKVITLSDFARYLYKQQVKSTPYDLRIYVDDRFVKFSESKLLDHEMSLLPSKYPEFSKIIEEYHDGILLFNLTEKMVWNKAVEDSIGLENYYQSNKSKYMWGNRVEAYTITSNNKENIEKAKMLTAKYGKKKKFNSDFLKEKVCPDDSLHNCIKVQIGMYEKGDNQYVDSTGWIKGTITEIKNEDNPGFVWIKRLIAPEIKTLDEAKGLITADYQNFLEEEWRKSLRDKYSVVVNKELLKKIQ